MKIITKEMIAEFREHLINDEKSTATIEKYVHDGKIPEGIHDQFGHEKKWNKSLIRYFANKKAFFHKLSRKYGIHL